MPEQPDLIDLSQMGGGVAILTLNRPDKYNALNGPMLDGLLDAISVIDQDDRVRALVLNGAGKSFAAGADIAEYSGATGEELQEFTQRANRAVSAVAECRVPVIAAVHGLALGGGFELALACDRIHMGEGAQVGLPELSLGLIPGWGGTQRLPRIIGAPNAFSAIAFGQRIDAANALRLGIAQQVDPEESLLDRAIVRAQEMAKLPPHAVAALRRAIASSLGDLAHGLTLEQRELLHLFETPDGLEGVAAFVEKRPPTFSGNQ